jgi:hypothetical protein
MKSKKLLQDSEERLVKPHKNVQNIIVYDASLDGSEAVVCVNKIRAWVSLPSFVTHIIYAFVFVVSIRAYFYSCYEIVAVGFSETACKRELADIRVKYYETCCD